MVEMTFPRPVPFDLPGVTNSWIARANGCSVSTVRRRRLEVVEDARCAELLANLSAETSLLMGRIRAPRGVLPLWSRMAIAEFAARGATYRELMKMFGVGRSTVYRALHRTSTTYAALSGCRQLTEVQARPILSMT